MPPPLDDHRLTNPPPPSRTAAAAAATAPPRKKDTAIPSIALPFRVTYMRAAAALAVALSSTTLRSLQRVEVHMRRYMKLKRIKRAHYHHHHHRHRQIANYRHVRYIAMSMGAKYSTPVPSVDGAVVRAWCRWRRQQQQQRRRRYLPQMQRRRVMAL